MAVEGLELSRFNLEAQSLGVATWPDGRAKLVRVDAPWPEGACVWNAGEMLDYTNAPPLLRAGMRAVKGVGVKR